MPYLRKWIHEDLLNNQDLFLLYREKLGRLLEWAEAYSDDALCIKLGRDPVTVAELTKYIREIQVRANNPDLCHDNCKSMYFCTLPKGHEGNHSEEGCLHWPQDDE